MHRMIRIALVAGVLASAGLVLGALRGLGAPEPPLIVTSGVFRTPSTIDGRAERTSERADARAPRVRAAAAPPSPPPAEAGAPRPATFAVATWTIGGIAVDGEGRRLGGIALGPIGHDRAVRTSRDGSFELDAPAVRARFEARDPGWATVASTVVTPATRAKRHVVVLARRARLTGRVVDAAGRPLEGLELEIRPELELGAEVDADGVVAREARATSAGDGRFDVEPVPSATPLRLTVRDGERVVDRRVIVADGAPLELVVGVEPATRVTGRVLDPSGRAVSAARVRQGAHEVRTTDEGRFALTLDASAAERLYAFADVGAAELDLAIVGAFEEVTLRLESAPDRLAGTVVTANGQPAAGWSVSVLDLESAGERPRDALDGPQRGALSTRTASDGTFELAGFVAAPRVALSLYDKRTATSVVTAPLRVGRCDLRLVVPDETERRTLTGRVVDRSGLALSGVRVRHERRLRVAGFAWNEARGALATTDDDGRFELVVGPGPAHVTATRGGFADGSVELPARGRGGIEIRLEERRGTAALARVGRTTR